MIAPPDWFTPPAVAAWHRIRAHLVARREWDDLFKIALEITAASCALYLAAAVNPEIRLRFVAEARQRARYLLAEMHFLPASRIALAPVTHEGLDADIAAVCAALPDQKGTS